VPNAASGEVRSTWEYILARALILVSARHDRRGGSVYQRGGSEAHLSS
jgi:hypothetical protein